MEVKTKSGVQVDIHSDGHSKILTFDRPVRSIELSKEESSQVSTLLGLNIKTGITAELRKLIIADFFSKPKSFRDIKKELQSNGVEIKSASLNTILGKLVERQELIRTGTSRAYLYQQP